MTTYLTWRREPTAPNIQQALAQFRAWFHSQPESIQVNPKDLPAVAALAGPLGLAVESTGGCLRYEFWLEVKKEN